MHFHYDVIRWVAWFQITVCLFALKGYIIFFPFLVFIFSSARKFTKLFLVSKLMIIMFSMWQFCFNISVKKHYILCFYCYSQPCTPKTSGHLTHAIMHWKLFEAAFSVFHSGFSLRGYWFLQIVKYHSLACID